MVFLQGKEEGKFFRKARSQIETLKPVTLFVFCSNPHSLPIAFSQTQCLQLRRPSCSSCKALARISVIFVFLPTSTMGKQHCQTRYLHPTALSPANWLVKFGTWIQERTSRSEALLWNQAVSVCISRYSRPLCKAKVRLRDRAG